MNTKDIRNALKSELAGASLGLTITYPNVNSNPGLKPRLEISIPDAEQLGGSINSTGIITESGSLLAVIVVDEGVGENSALDFADSIANALPQGYKIIFTGGALKITGRPSVQGGYSDLGDYRVPVLVRYNAWNV